MAALAFGIDQRLPVAVRGGGHNVAGNAVCDGGLVIDLSPMKGIARRSGRPDGRAAQAGLTWGEFDRETQAFGLATTGGAVSTTGIAGLTLGGGIGWLQRKYGLTCDNLLSADVVTADGRLLTASATENADLFWGLRGGGGNFGIVTSFEYQLHPVGPRARRSRRLPVQRGRERVPVLPGVHERRRRTICSLEFGMATLPDGQRVVMLFVVYVGPIEAGEDVAAAPARLRVAAGGSRSCR